MTDEKLEYLKQKASSLPRTPGVYIMKDRAGKVIYVGKSRSLRDRVSQYFHLSSDANVKTVRMVSQVNDFDTVFCDTEIEALALENVKIKQFTPKYNILLKDSKSYPYIKVTTNEAYPRIVMTRKRLNDDAKYFGPYSGTSVIYGVMGTLERSLVIPTCKRVFPRDIGKERPCIYKQLGRCVAPCDSSISNDDYLKLIQCAIDILRGNIKGASNELARQMTDFAKNEKFEDAARCRDAIKALERLRDSQKVVGSLDDDYDIIASYSNDISTCISVFYIRSGIIADSNNFIYGANEIAFDYGYEYMSSFISELYSKRGYVPKEILLAFDFDDRELTQEYLRNAIGKNVFLRVPQKGLHKKLCDMVELNAKEQANQYKSRMEHDTKVLAKLSKMLSLDCIPERIEAYDISNLGNEQITAGMIVSENGKFKKSDYRLFKIKGQSGADDYSAMSETIRRRFSHLCDEGGSYSQMPDLVLLDGGSTHVGITKKVLADMNIDVPVFGMVKDEHHKTRTIVTESDEISIAKEQSVFVFVYKIQEEVHRFTVSAMDKSKRKTLKTSSLEKIDGIGTAKAKKLLAYFKTLSALKKAGKEDIAKVEGISSTDAENIYHYFNGAKE